MSGLPDWIGGFFSAIVSEVGSVFKDDAGNSNSQPVEAKSNSSNESGPLDWIRGGFSDIGSQIGSVFKDDAGASNSVPVEAKSNSSAQERGKASYIQGEDLERYTEQKLEEFGLNANWYPPENKLLFDETSEKFGKLTQVDITIEDDNGEELAIIECKAYGPNSRLSGPKAVDQVNRLIHVAEERGIPLIFSTSDGTTDCFGKDVMEVLNQTQCFVISADNIAFADPSDVKETGVTLGLPPVLQDHWEFGTGPQPESIDIDDDSSNDADSVDDSSNSEDRNVYYDLFGNRYEETISNDSSNDSSSNSEDSGGFWDWFGGSDSGSNDTSDYSSSDSGDSGYDSDSSDTSDYSSSDYDSDSNYDSSSYDSSSSDSSDYSSSDYDSDSSYDSSSYDSSSSDSSDYSSSDSGDSGGSWDLFGSSYDSSSSDSSDYSSSDYDSDSSSDSSSSSSDSWW